MAPPPHRIHPSKTLEETSALWYPMIRSLGWNRSAADGPMHYHAAADGQTWLLLTPEQASTATTPDASPDSSSSSVTQVSKPQGCVAAFTFSNGTGWIGFFILDAAYQGEGLGGALWRGMDDIWARAGVEVIGLDGVEEQVATYARRGFVDVGRIPLMVCSAEDVARVNREGGGAEPEGVFGDVRKASRIDLAELDRKLTGLQRDRYWISSDLLERDDVFGYAHYLDAKLAGFVLVRGCEEGHRIGPLLAPSLAVASHLLRLVMQHKSVAMSKGTLIAEVFGGNLDARSVFKKLRWMDAGVEYHRMWCQGKVPEAQAKGGLGTKGMFAIFDAACG